MQNNVELMDYYFILNDYCSLVSLVALKVACSVNLTAEEFIKRKMNSSGSAQINLSIGQIYHAMIDLIKIQIIV